MTAEMCPTVSRQVGPAECRKLSVTGLRKTMYKVAIFAKIVKIIFRMGRNRPEREDVGCGACQTLRMGKLFDTLIHVAI
jgi:hypothetical protein